MSDTPPRSGEASTVPNNQLTPETTLIQHELEEPSNDHSENPNAGTSETRTEGSAASSSNVEQTSHGGQTIPPPLTDDETFAWQH